MESCLLGGFFQLCYTFKMSDPSQETIKWAQFLHEKKLSGFFRFLYNAGLPLSTLLAQLMYLSEPFFPNCNLQKMASILENRMEAEQFLGILNKLDSNG